MLIITANVIKYVIKLVSKFTHNHINIVKLMATRLRNFSQSPHILTNLIAEQAADEINLKHTIK